MARLQAQLRLIRVQVAEQDARLPLADVQAGELPQALRVVAPIADGDVDSQLARVGACPVAATASSTAKPRSLSATDGALDAVAVGEAEDGLGVQQRPTACRSGA